MNAPTANATVTLAAPVLDAMAGSTSLPSSKSASQSTHCDGEASPLTSVGGMASQSQESQPAKSSEGQQMLGSPSVPKETLPSTAEHRELPASINFTVAPVGRRSPVPVSPTSRSSSQSIAGQKRLASGSIKSDARGPSMSTSRADQGVDGEAPSADRIREVSAGYLNDPE